jgi:adenylyltransferase/sulfurtransferase
MGQDSRYDRQILLKEIGKEGQEKISKSRAAVIGMGALGSIASSLLARSGVSELSIIDRDTVDLTNLQRQTLYSEDDIGKAKAIAASERLGRINSEITIKPLIMHVDRKNIEQIVGKVDVVVDGTDNMSTRFLINDACVKLKKPWVYGGVVGTQGMSLSIVPGITPCLRCVFPKIPAPGTLPTCDTAGIANTLPAMIGAIEVTEALKIVLGQNPAEGLLVVDLWNWDCRRVSVLRNLDCRACGSGDFDFLEGASEEQATVLCGNNAVQIAGKITGTLDLEALALRLEKVGPVKVSEGVVIARIDDYELAVFRDGRAVVKGTSDEGKARALYASYIGN